MAVSTTAKNSSPSTRSSSVVATSSVADVLPAGNVSRPEPCAGKSLPLVAVQHPWSASSAFRQVTVRSCGRLTCAVVPDMLRTTGNDAVPPSSTVAAVRLKWISTSPWVMTALAVAVPSVTPAGRVAALMVAVKVSTISTGASAVVATCSVADVLPAGIVATVCRCAV